MEFTIREVRLTDTAAVAGLCGELGYPVAESVLEARMRHVAEDPHHAVLVACAPDGALIGWVDVGMTFHLQSGSYAEIGGLVVTASARRNGVGKELVRRAELWASARGAARIIVRSNATRADAHRFYLRENYQQKKTSAVFEKSLK
jgi:GNAT superfamily N-acetyltransferase